MRGTRLIVVASLCPIAAATSCSNRSPAVIPVDLETRASALLAPIQNDFEDGTTQGWIPRGPVTLTSTPDMAFTGARSLVVNGRTAGFNGPSLPLTGQLAKGATYQIGVAVRLVSGSAPTTIRLTMQRTLVDSSNVFDTVAQNTNVTDATWTTFRTPYTFSTDTANILLYVEATDPTVSYFIDAFTLIETAPQPLATDWEDGTLQGWIPRGNGVVLTNTTEQAVGGTRSLKATGRTSGFMGPSLPLTGQMTKGAVYGVAVAARLVAGEPATTLRVTMQRMVLGGVTNFDTIANNTNVTDAAWVTMTGIYTFNTDVTDLLLYVESTSATASYYIDSFSIVQLAPPPQIPPPNTTGAAATFESNTPEGWASRTGGEQVATSTADAHAGTHSLLTTNRTQTFQGPAFDVTNVMFNGSRYRVEIWAKLAPGEPSTQLRVSLERRLGTFLTSFHTLVGNTTVTSDAWVRLAATFDDALANTSLILFVESTSAATASYYIDDFSISLVVPDAGTDASSDVPDARTDDGGAGAGGASGGVGGGSAGVGGGSAGVGGGSAGVGGGSGGSTGTGGSTTGANGSPCASRAECASDHCIDGRCCATDCAGGTDDCQACSTAAGGTLDGTCTPRTTGRPCAAACEEGTCNGSSTVCPGTTPVPECTFESTGGGTNVPVEVNGGLSTVGGALVVFSEVSGGDVTVTGSTVGPPPPDEYGLVPDGLARYFYIDTTASYPDGADIVVCLHYDQNWLPDLDHDGFGDECRAPARAEQECALQLVHYDAAGTPTALPAPPAWTGLDPLDTTANTICGLTHSLSPFALAIPLDRTAPVFTGVPDTITAYATSTQGAKVTYATPTATDALEGPVDVSCTPASGSQFHPGTTTVTCTAADSRGNPASATFTVWVQYQAPAGGAFFLDPINANGSSIFKKGSTVPVKFRLQGASAGIKNLVAHLSVAKVSNGIEGTSIEAVSTSAADAGNTFRFDPGCNQYIFNLSTKPLSTGTWSLRVDLGDEVTHNINISLK